MATVALAALARKYDVVDSFREFLITNNVVGIASGIIVGAATMVWIRSMSMDVVLPLLDILILGTLRFFNASIANNIGSTLFQNTVFHWGSAARETVTWIVSLTVTFSVMHFMFRRFVRKNQKKKENEQFAGNKRGESAPP